jgi:hypothetical protein
VLAHVATSTITRRLGAVLAHVATSTITRRLGAVLARVGVAAARVPAAIWPARPQSLGETPVPR